METKDIIKELRKKRGYSAQQVADGCDMSLGVYKKYESGERGVGVPALSKLADFYNVSTDYLLGRDTGKPAPLDQYAGTVNMSELEHEIVDGYFKLDSKMRDVFMNMLESAVENVKNGRSALEQNEPLFMASRSTDDRPPELKTLTPEQRKRLAEAPDESKNPDNDL